MIKENHPAGAKLVEVSKDELARTYGGGNVQPESTPPFACDYSCWFRHCDWYCCF
ncbi:mersacidin family lantibiotic [Bacillus thuringiensis]|nr:mersacidin family lantibiotic [Bacillus thuringiensis]